MLKKSELISIIIPCHNEAASIEALHAELTRVVDEMSERFEFIMVDDGSRDATVETVRAMRHHDPRIRLIELARNFGKEIAVTAGLNNAKGEAAITIDADLQHPPALIPELIAKWRQGNEVVVGVRQVSGNYAPWAKRFFSKLFYRIMRAIAETEIVPNSTDYRLLDRVVIDEFNRFTERNRLTRGLIDWLGFSRAYVTFTPAERFAGEAAYSYIKLVGLALNSFVSMSLFPLKFAGYLGISLICVTVPIGSFIFVERFMLGDPFGLGFTGPAILAVIILFVCGVILSSLGLMALYIANIHSEVMNRPLYVARRERFKQSLAEHNEEQAESLIDEVTIEAPEGR